MLRQRGGGDGGGFSPQHTRAKRDYAKTAVFRLLNFLWMKAAFRTDQQNQRLARLHTGGGEGRGGLILPRHNLLAFRRKV